MAESSDEEIKSSKNTKNDDEKKSAPKIEKKPEEKVPDDVPLIFDNVKVKQEPIDEPGNILLKIKYYTVIID